MKSTRTLWVCSQIKKCRSWFLLLSTSMILGENVFLDMLVVQKWLSGFAWSWLTPCWCLWRLTGSNCGSTATVDAFRAIIWKSQTMWIALKVRASFYLFFFPSSTIAAKCTTEENSIRRTCGGLFCDGRMWFTSGVLRIRSTNWKEDKKIKHPITVLTESWENEVIKKNMEMSPLRKEYTEESTAWLKGLVRCFTCYFTVVR